MQLLVFAHRAEAQIFLKKLPYRWVSTPFGGYYQGDHTAILLTGEGLQNATESLSSLLSFLGDQISEVINLGVCGALDESIPPNTIYSLRTAYCENEFKSFSTDQGKEALDCFSARQRITHKMDKKRLSVFAPLVDREVWAIGSVCKRFQKSWRAYKIVSDIAATETMCGEIYQDAAFYSQELYQFYEKNVSQWVSTQVAGSREKLPDKLEKQGFYFTFSQRNLLKNLFEKYSILNDVSEKKFLDSRLVQELKKQKIKPKLKSEKLLHALYAELFPLQQEIVEKLEQIKNNLKKENIHFEYDRTLESPLVNFQIDVSQPTTLTSVPLQEIQKQLGG
ncbi:MAG: hypothetical protein H6621_12525 [Halobacteriovoraceae bacterium]|nr:hypothetical protein [Halobacteriovoraceae bacterium]